MRRFFSKIMAFMYGRYGFDALGITLLAIYCSLAFVAIFIKSIVAAYILLFIRTFLFAVIFCRYMSRNIYARRHENDKFLKFFGSIWKFIKLQLLRARDVGRKRYRTCPKCKSIARLPIRRGRHTVRCPVCKNEFKVRIII